jgi:hypothetical protein
VPVHGVTWGAAGVKPDRALVARRQVERLFHAGEK